MEQVWKNIVKAAAAAGGAIAGAMGGWDATLRVLLVMMVVDYISGMMVAVMGKSPKTEYGGLSSKVGFVGLAKKGLMLLVVLVATMLDEAMGMAIFRDAACWFYIANEGLSLLENLSLVGVPFPEKIKALLGHKLNESNKQEYSGGGDVGEDT